MNPFRVGRFIGILIFVLIFIAASWFFYSKLTALESTLGGQQQQIHALNEKLAARAKIDSLDLQERCSNQARKEFESLGYKFSSGDDYESHCNAELNKCFILIKSYHANVVFKFLSDAYEGKQYASYSYIAQKGNDYIEPRPLECKVTLPSGEVKSCNSDEEFTALIKIYMEDSADKKAAKLQSLPQK
jgi:uncharacterized coiled-coil protein SlyX